MRKQIIPQRLAAGLMSLVMLLTLLPAMSTTAEATDKAEDFFTVSGSVNGAAFTAKPGNMGSDGTTALVQIPVMYQGIAGQTIQITAKETVTDWSIVLGDQPKWMTLAKDSTTWKLTVTDINSMPEYENGRFLLKATLASGESRSIWVYYFCFEKTKYQPKITTESSALPVGNVGSSYYASLDFDAGVYEGWATWEFVVGDKVIAHNADKTPLTEYGLTMNANLMMCNIQGTPTAEGDINFSLRVTTTGGTSEKKDFTIHIDKAKTAPKFMASEKFYAEIGKEYTATAPLLNMNSRIKTDGYPVLKQDSWSDATGLPTGLTLNADGTITGTVADGTTQGSYYVKAKVSNGTNTYGAELELFVYAKPTATASESSKDAKAGEYFLWKPLADSGNIPFPRWKIVSGGTVNDAETLESQYGLTFNTSTGDIYGKPTKDGTLTLKVQCIARDNNGNEITGAVSEPVTLTLNIAPDRRFALDQTGTYGFPSVTVDSGGATTADDSTKRAREFTVTGTGYSDVTVNVALSGDNADSFTLGGTTTDTLKQGKQLTFTVQPKSGLSASADAYTATVTVSDAADETNKLTFDVSFTVSAYTVTPYVTNYSNLPYAKAGETYTYQFSAAGTPDYKWQIVGSSGRTYPTGISIDDTGKVTWNVPDDWLSGSVGFRVTADPNFKVEDDGTYSGNNSDVFFQVYEPVQLKLQEGTASSGYVDITDKEAGRLLLPEGYVNRDYNIDYDNNSVSGYRLMIDTNSTADRLLIEGALPAGMELHTNEEYAVGAGAGSSGQLTGTPAKAGTYDFTVVAQKLVGDELVYETRQPVRLVIHEEFTVSGHSFSSTELSMEVGTPVSVDLSRYVSGGKKPYTFSTTSTLPSGLELNATTGVLSGTPGEAVQGFSFLMTVTDANGVTSYNNNMIFGKIKLPPLELTDASGASFINKISVGLSEEYLTKIGKAGSYTLEYHFKPDGSYGYWSDWKTATDYTKPITLSLTDDIESFLKSNSGWVQSLDVGKPVWVELKLTDSATNMAGLSEKIEYTRVAKPAAPTASPGEDGETTTFVGDMTLVQLFTTTSGSGIGILYTTDGTEPAVTVSGLTMTAVGSTQAYTGTPIAVSDGTVIKARCYKLSATLKRLNVTCGDVATFTYAKAAGVTVSGSATSWNNTDNALYYRRQNCV